VAVQLAGIDTERLGIPANKVSVVEIKAGEAYEQRELTALGSQIKQEIADRLKDNLRGAREAEGKRPQGRSAEPKRFVIRYRSSSTA